MRKLEISLYGYSYDLVAKDTGSKADGRLPADAEAASWFPYFAEYQEDASGRLVSLWQPLCASYQGFLQDLQWIRSHPRPHFADVFDQVDVIKEYPAGKFKTVKTLHRVTLLQALEALVEIFSQL